MIICMPFTYLPSHDLEKITRHLGVLAVYAPLPEQVPETMRRFAAQGLLDLRTPGSLDAGRLALALDQFRQWADMHRGSIADMAGFLKSSAGRPPLVDPTSPTQISSEVRRFGESRKETEVAPLFRAALFLAMAQSYDRHHDDMARELGAVSDMEKRMLERLTGDGGEDPGGALRTTGSDSGLQSGEEPGLFMTDERIGAWAELALADSPPAHLFLTTSPAVMGQLGERFPDAVFLGHWSLETGTGEDVPVKERRRRIAGLAEGAGIEEGAFDGCMTAARPGDALTMSLFVLDGCPPRSMLSRLLGRNEDRDRHSGPAAGGRNTVFGLVSFRGEQRD
jgi:hypothetical protein